VSPLVSTIILQNDELNGAGKEGFSQSVVRITSASHWNEISEKLSIVNPFERNFDIHRIDFETTNLYVYTDKIRPTAGYELSISNSKKKEGSYNFNIQIKRPHGSFPDVITQPLLIFTIVKTTEIQGFSFLEL